MVPATKGEIETPASRRFREALEQNRVSRVAAEEEQLRRRSSRKLWLCEWRLHELAAQASHGALARHTPSPGQTDGTKHGRVRRECGRAGLGASSTTGQAPGAAYPPIRHVWGGTAYAYTFGAWPCAPGHTSLLLCLSLCELRSQQSPLMRCLTPLITTAIKRDMCSALVDATIAATPYPQCHRAEQQALL